MSRSPASETLIANLATYPPRREAMIETVRSLSPQVDVINVVLNEYDSVPEELSGIDNVEAIIPPENMRDIGKFYPTAPDGSYVFLVDDDIVYPKDYAAVSMELYRSHADQRRVGGYHGTIYTKPLFKLFKHRLRKWVGLSHKHDTFFRKVFHYSFADNEFRAVDQLGTGLVVAKQDYLPSYEYMKTAQKFADVRFAKWCFEKEISLVALPKNRGWLGSVEFEETIYGDFTVTSPDHVCEEILEFAYKRSNLGEAIGG